MTTDLVVNNEEEQSPKQWLDSSEELAAAGERLHGRR